MGGQQQRAGLLQPDFKLVLPIVIQNLLSAAVNSADVVMLNYVGQSAISAGIPGIQLCKCIIYGLLRTGNRSNTSVCPVLWKGNMRAIQTVEGIALRFSVIISIVVAGITFTIATDDDASVYR